MSIFEFINTIVENVMNDLGAFAPVLACFLIIIESIFPILPLSLFITINGYYMGYIPGFIIRILIINFFLSIPASPDAILTRNAGVNGIAIIKDNSSNFNFCICLVNLFNFRCSVLSNIL